MSGPMKSPVDRPAEILNAISGKVDLPIVSWKYVTGLMITAAAITLVPLLYLAVMVLLVIAEYAFFLNLTSLLGGYSLAIRLMAIFAVVILGASVLLGLIKPFFATAAADRRPRTLRREAEPFLYEFVDQLCDALGARRPTNIYVTCDLNAAAESRDGWFSCFRRGKVSLYLGLPLVAGLSLRQFTGVLAHEPGHFNQRAGMSLENIVRRTNMWFLRAAFERDAVDDWLDAPMRCWWSTGNSQLFCAGRGLGHSASFAGFGPGRNNDRLFDVAADGIQCRSLPGANRRIRCAGFDALANPRTDTGPSGLVSRHRLVL